MNKKFIDENTLQKIIEGIKGVTVCTIGDVCLDFYAFADMKLSSLSRETPHYPLPVVKETFSPGGGGNVINNIKALGVKELLPVSVIGNDWRGFILAKYFEQNGFNQDYILRCDDFVTTCYLKPMRMGISDVVYEDPRLDFENRGPISSEIEEKLIENLKNAAARADILVVSDQMKNGIITDRVRGQISLIAKRIPVIVDSRENSAKYEGVIVKPNEVEAAFIIGRDITGLDLDIGELCEIGNALQIKNGAPALVTLGDKGAIWCENGSVTLTPTIKAEPPVDFVGAGDTFLSAFSCAFASGASGSDAAAFANLASGVTVKKIGTTGTATPGEIMEKFKENEIKWEIQ